MTTNVQTTIQTNLPKNRELLDTLAQTEYAAHALKQQKQYVADLEKDIKRLNEAIKKLDTSRLKELKEHESYRDSKVKRFAYKATGQKDKFDARASKEQQEFHDATAAQKRETDVRDSTQKLLDEAKNHATELDSVTKRHQQAQSELDQLYDSIFEGPTPDFPSEDARESDAHRILQQYHNTSIAVDCEGKANAFLARAQSQMKSAVAAMEKARSYSTQDMFIGGSYADAMERQSLSEAERAVMEAQMSIMQAQQNSPHVKSIPKPQIDHANVMSDIVFDNIFSDANFHEKIKAGQVRVQECAIKVDQEMKDAKIRLDNLKRQMADEGRQLDEARVALQKVREAAFEHVAQSHS